MDWWKPSICQRSNGIALQRFQIVPQGFTCGTCRKQNRWLSLTPFGCFVVLMNETASQPSTSCSAVLVSWARALLFTFSFLFLLLILVSWLQAEEGGAVPADSWRTSSPRRRRSSQTGSGKEAKGCRGGAGKGGTAAPTGRRERTEGERRDGAYSETSMLPSWNFCAGLVDNRVNEATLLEQYLKEGYLKFRCYIGLIGLWLTSFHGVVQRVKM